uniref:Uncharacterized protein n=1 Tax=Noctiluca scintillans TaxID=2966 RepID=A0A7S1AH88_NOCSC|mmetsp:Transcript_46188/g.122438  ORF Transcript_46188/g.122438 Transcript_46188/m.122438 type:complete len:195 (+) Transcript_46188:56-640(+)
MDLKALAAEREARSKDRKTEAMPNPWAKSLPTPKTTRVTTAARASGGIAKAHRSIRMAHSLAVLLALFNLLLLFFTSGRHWGVNVLLLGAAVWLGRVGGALVHSILPAMLREGAPPTDNENSAAFSGIFCRRGLRNPSESLHEEWSTLLENLAFACTYGKQNCLTGQMYYGELTLGKIVGLVWGKLREGVVQCG